MSLSLRKLLLIYLLLAIAFTTTLTIVANYYLDEEDIEYHLDSTISQSTLIIQALLSDIREMKDLDLVQKKLDTVPSKAKQFFEKEIRDDPHDKYEDKFQFQVWDKDGKLLLHSANAPKIPFSNEQMGFSIKHLGLENWRMFTSFDETTGLTIVVSEEDNVRNELFNRITKNDFYILLLTFPISGVLIWFTIGRGLRSLRRIADDVSNRAATYLVPVATEGVPKEIAPVINELNLLFIRLTDTFDREKRFAADAAHELKTPLAAMKIQSQVALSTKSSAEQQTALQNIVASVDRSSHIVQQLLTLSSLVPETMTPDKYIKVDITKLATDIIAELAPNAIEKNVEIELIANEKGNRIKGLVTPLSIMLRNLIDNAIRYTPAGGHVFVYIHPEEANLVLKVVDTGPGIPIELRNRVFERFFRVIGSTSPGSGLGLSIVKQIANLHNAEVILDQREEGSGLVVTVRFALL